MKYRTNCLVGLVLLLSAAVCNAQTSSAEEFTSNVKIQGAVTQSASGNNVKQDLNVGSMQKSKATSFKADVTTGSISQTGKNGANQTINVGGMNNSKVDRFDARVTTGNIEQVANRGERQELDIGSVSNSTVSGTAKTRVSVGNVKQTGEGEIALGAVKNSNVQQFQSNLTVKGKIEGNNIRMGSVVGKPNSLIENAYQNLSEPSNDKKSSSKLMISAPITSTIDINHSLEKRKDIFVGGSSKGENRIGKNVTEVTASSHLLEYASNLQQQYPYLSSLLKRIAESIVKTGITRFLEDQRSIDIFNMLFTGAENSAGLVDARRILAFEDALNDTDFRINLDRALNEKLLTNLTEAGVKAVLQGLLLETAQYHYKKYYGEEQAEYFKIIAGPALSIADNLAGISTGATSATAGVVSLILLDAKILSGVVWDSYVIGKDLAQQKDSGRDIKSQIVNLDNYNEIARRSLAEGVDSNGNPLSEKLQKIYLENLEFNSEYIQQMVFADEYLNKLRSGLESDARWTDKQIDKVMSAIEQPIQSGGGSW